MLLDRADDDLLAVVQHDDVVGAAADEEEAVLVEVAEVAGADDAVAGEDPLGLAGLGVLVAGVHRMLAAHADDTVLVEQHLLARQHPAHAALAVGAGVVLGDDAGLVEAVALEDRQAGRR